MFKRIVLSACSVLFAASVYAAPEGKHHVLLDTDMGQIEVELDEAKAPISTKNFLAYVDSGFYSGTQFHRVIPGFMVQGGGYDRGMNEKPTQAPIKNEADNGLRNLTGTLAMARTSDVNSATSQFFINVNDNEFLDHGSRDFGYAVFGKVTKGMDVVTNIVQARTTSRGGMQNVPADPIMIKSAKRID
ncbi:peptidylprolyl isomerase [Pseudomonas sp. RIT-PI-S]|uniref:peptidylprolyl isomerase n=1 Tax=Pseudomonas sp. RIT-PI-S TaxID=3035295 RepID=UPI0021DA7588|nr:peptidylprolyl isomerase [Pseudomonas sp. RIT-PI-S]